LTSASCEQSDGQVSARGRLAERRGGPRARVQEQKEGTHS